MVRFLCVLCWLFLVNTLWAGEDHRSQAPSLHLPEQRLMVDQNFSYVLGRPDDHPTYRAVSLPPGATFDPAASLLTFTPSDLQVGEQVAVFTAISEDRTVLLPLLVVTECEALEPTQLTTQFLFDHNDELEGLELRFSRPLSADQDWQSALPMVANAAVPTWATDPSIWFMPLTTESFLAKDLDIKGDWLRDALGCPVDVDGDGLAGGELLLSAEDLYAAYDLRLAQDQAIQVEQLTSTPIQIETTVQGTIAVAGEEDVYTFVASANQAIFFDIQQYVNVSSVEWRCVAPNGTQVFRKCLGCGDPGVMTLTAAGTYTLTVGKTTSSQTGSYQFRLWNVPAPQSFALQVGSSVANGVPGVGAGNIESPGVKDVYTFSANAGQSIFFDNQGAVSTVQSDTWECRDANGLLVFSTCLGCGDPGVKTLAGGTYTITVGSNTKDSVGTYQFKLWDVPPTQTFAIQVGSTVANGVPGVGAGNIETPGVKDIYSFSASAGQSIFFDYQGGVSTVLSDTWECRDANGQLVFSTCLGCGDPGVFTLPGGTYTITVGSNNKDAVGTYQFKLWNVPPAQTFAIQLGTTVANGVPSAGAGNIETPGVKDRYTFSVTAGKTVYFDIQAVDSSVSTNRWECRDANGLLVYSTCLGCGDPGLKTLTTGGTYTITVGSNSEDLVGTYKFKVWSVPATKTFGIQVGSTVSNGVPALGAGNIESPGTKDLYTFSVSPGRVVFFDVQGTSGVAIIDWKCTDANGTQIFSSCLGCGDPGNKTLSLGGTYTITVGSTNNSSVGTYQFQIR